MESLKLHRKIKSLKRLTYISIGLICLYLLFGFIGSIIPNIEEIYAIFETSSYEEADSIINAKNLNREFLIIITIIGIRFAILFGLLFITFFQIVSGFKIQKNLKTLNQPLHKKFKQRYSIFVALVFTPLIGFIPPLVAVPCYFIGIGLFYQLIREVQQKIEV